MIIAKDYVAQDSSGMGGAFQKFVSPKIIAHGEKAPASTRSALTLYVFLMFLSTTASFCFGQICPVSVFS
jgi:hypothetical protein